MAANRRRKGLESHVPGLTVKLLSDIADLLLPRVCAGCGIETVSLCGDCIEALDGPVVRSQPRFGHLPVSGAGVYDGVLRNVLVAYKENGRRDIVAVLGLLLARAVVDSLQNRQIDGKPVILVPVPSSSSAVRRRGGNHVAAFAESAAQMLRSDGLRAGCADVLTVSRHRDQVGFGSAARKANVEGTHAIAREHTHLVRQWGERAKVVVVDDISTTGATGAESTRALMNAGCTPDGLAVIGIARGSSRQLELDAV
ncbi:MULTISPECIES: ComF family protein [Brevibacterium]|uniref:ComF family protein n=1 Tax=Brevibacterium TaxID=1696 RepID=UPI00114CE50A|nr:MULTISPECIES: ComF family protein [Brevibacterium]